MLLVILLLLLFTVPILALWIRSWRRQFLAEAMPPAYRFVRAKERQLGAAH